MTLWAGKGREHVRRAWEAAVFLVADLARRLVQNVEDAWAARGIEIVTCLIETPNAGSMRFFESMGYVRADDIVYYSKRQRPES